MHSTDTTNTTLEHTFLRKYEFFGTRQELQQRAEEEANISNKRRARFIWIMTIIFFSLAIGLVASLAHKHPYLPYVFGAVLIIASRFVFHRLTDINTLTTFKPEMNHRELEAHLDKMLETFRDIFFHQTPRDTFSTLGPEQLFVPVREKLWNYAKGHGNNTLLQEMFSIASLFGIPTHTSVGALLDHIELIKAGGPKTERLIPA